MARFRYPLQVALDDAAERERAGRVALAGAQHALDEEQASLARLRAQAKVTRAELVRDGAAPASIYVEVGLRLQALAGAEKERIARIARATRSVAQARDALAALSQRHKAIERHRDRAREKFLAAQALREAAEFDESNALRAGSNVIRA